MRGYELIEIDFVEKIKFFLYIEIWVYFVGVIIG